MGKWHPTDEANSVLSIASYLGLGSAEAKWPPRNPPGEVTADPPTPFTRLQFWTDLLKIYIVCVSYSHFKDSQLEVQANRNHLSVIGFESVLECVLKFQICQMFWNVLQILIWLTHVCEIYLILNSLHSFMKKT